LSCLGAHFLNNKKDLNNDFRKYKTPERTEKNEGRKNNKHIEMELNHIKKNDE
jgi:hypothetical protein